MNDLPAQMIAVLALFSPYFSKPTFQKLSFLTFGHILAKGRRTVTEILRLLGLKDIKNYSKYHAVFNKSKWSPLNASRALFLRLTSLVKGRILISIDSTVERRKGPKIKGLGIQRDAVRSTKKKKVLTTGLNWLVSTIHIKLPWAEHEWALPFLTILMPPSKPLSSSKNENDLKKVTQYKTLNDWACQVAFLLRRWTKCPITIVADSAFATYQFANTCVDLGISLVSRMRLDARFYDFPPEPTGKKGRKKIVGKRISTPQQTLDESFHKWTRLIVNWYGGNKNTIEVLTGTCLWYGYGIRKVPIRWVLVRGLDGYGEPICLFSTNINSSAAEIIEDFVGRWKIEVLFEECRRHLGIETQRQWSDKAIERTTPMIFASFSIINLIALEYFQQEQKLPIQKTSWYQKDHVTFSDVLAFIREKFLRKKYFLGFEKNYDPEKINIEELLCNIEELLCSMSAA